MKRLLLKPEHLAILTGMDVEAIQRAYQEGQIPRWRLQGKKGIFFDIADIEKVFKIPRQKYFKRKNRRSKRCK